MKRHKALTLILGLLVMLIVQAYIAPQESFGGVSSLTVTVIDNTTGTPNLNAVTVCTLTTNPCYIAGTYGNIRIQDVSSTNRAQISWTDGLGTSSNALTISYVKITPINNMAPVGSIIANTTFLNGLTGSTPYIYAACSGSNELNGSITTTGTVFVPNVANPLVTIPVGQNTYTFPGSSTYNCQPSPFTYTSSTQTNGGATLQIEIDFSLTNKTGGWAIFNKNTLTD